MKMGRKSRKRKKTSSSQENSVSDDSSTQGEKHDTSIVSSILSAANHVLYGSPSKVLNTSTPIVNKDKQTSPKQANIKTSTPKTSINDKSGDDNELCKIVSDNNKKLNAVLSKLSKLDRIEAQFTKLEHDVIELKTSVSELRAENIENVAALEFLTKEVEQIKLDEEKTKTMNLEREIERHKVMIEKLSRGVDTLRRERDEMNEKVTDLQWRSMKNNLVFTGLGGESNEEDCEAKLRQFMNNELGIHHFVEFGNVHRFGKRTRGKDRPIVAIYFCLCMLMIQFYYQNQQRDYSVC